METTSEQSAACPLRETLLACPGHALVVGGPGSGKTTIALRKGLARIRQGLVAGQTILFLSFSRAAVTRVLDAAKLEVPKAELDMLSMQTFHSFFWDLLKANAYLLGAPRKLSILLPHDEKALSGGMKESGPDWDQWRQERERLFWADGRIVFDLFAPYAAKLLEKSVALRAAVALRHPLIIVDEAQDTGDAAWRCIELLAPHSQIICLADLEQQIFDFLPGVGPERVNVIRAALTPLEVDFGEQNHRSPDSEILTFANDILAVKLRGGPYKGVSAIPYVLGRGKAPNWNHLLRRALFELHNRIRQQTGNSAKTVAILTSSRDNALKVSNALNALGSNVGKSVRHKLLFDEAESILSARFAAFLLEPAAGQAIDTVVAAGMELLASAKGATGTSKSAVATLRAQALKIRSGKALDINIANALRLVIGRLRADGFTGNPEHDWLSVKRCLRESGQAELTRVASQLDFLVAFQRGHRISAGLSAEWIRDGAYTHARLALDAALTQEQILDGIESPRGLHVMNIHKAKGKQFDGVILIREPNFAGTVPTSSFVWFGDTPPYERSRRILRVGASRARKHLLILNPSWPKCPLLKGFDLS
jgi:DNA helicase-2/ATP-dependent DNA helicase PcrA